MARKDCEVCGQHRARWLLEVKDNREGKVFRIKTCGICRWRLWPTSRKKKPIEVIRVLAKIRGTKRPLLQPRIKGKKRK